jgi:hypothetical protein
MVFVMNGKIKVWKLEIFGSWIIFNSLKELIQSLECDLEDIDKPEDIIISPEWMYKHEFESLPEFEGH